MQDMNIHEFTAIKSLSEELLRQTMAHGGKRAKATSRRFEWRCYLAAALMLPLPDAFYCFSHNFSEPKKLEKIKGGLHLWRVLGLLAS